MSKFIHKLRPRQIAVAEKYDPLPHQVSFHTSAAKYRAMVSGVGGGKTTMGVREILKWTQLYPGGLFVIGRLTAKALEGTTQRRFFEICDPQLIEHWQANKGHLWLKTNATYPNGDPVFTEILFMHLDDPGPLGSLDISGFWIDEAHEPDGGEVPESTFQLLQARLRNEVGPHRGFVTTNSGGKDWIWRWFFDEKRPDHMKEEFWGMVVSSRDNPFLPPGYVEGLIRNNPKTWVDRFIEASFDAFEGQIFQEFDEKEHVISLEEFNKMTFAKGKWDDEGGFDFGVIAPTAFLESKYNAEEDMLLICSEIYQENAEPETVAKAMLDLGFDWSWADPSVAYTGTQKVTPKEIYAAFGVDLIPSENDEDTFFAMLQWRLRHNKIKIVECCENLIAEIKSAAWDPSYNRGHSTKPKAKKGKDFPDHARDALKYLVLKLGVNPDSMRAHEDEYEKFQKMKKLHPSVVSDLENEGYMFDEIIAMIEKGKVTL